MSAKIVFHVGPVLLLAIALGFPTRLSSAEAQSVATNLTVEKAPLAAPLKIKSADGYCEITVDTSGEPELKKWAEQKLAPVLAEWYPKIAVMLSSDGFSAPTQFSVLLKPGNGVAATSGTRITANSSWVKRELNGEAVGALVHEEIHVVQSYGRGRGGNSDYKRPPGWLVEGIPDYIRWFLFEPQSHGADIVWLAARRNLSLSYNSGYRITANFLNYVVENYDKQKDLITKINAACRRGEYKDALWQQLTGKPLAELNDEWKAGVQKQLGAKTD